jgi:flagellar biosynthesis protein FlhF
MRVKKFEAKSMKEALQMVKNELGPDAVILAARDNRKSFGIAGNASVEVTAAVSESTLQKKKFVESRLTQPVRERFQATDARTQRKIIDKMVEARAREAERETERELASRRPITKTSYIDIPDEEVESAPRRQAAYERAAGRNVRDLLDDFDQDFEVESDEWQQRPTREAGRVALTMQAKSLQERIQQERLTRDRAQARTRTSEAPVRTANSRGSGAGSDAGMDMHNEHDPRAHQANARTQANPQAPAAPTVQKAHPQSQAQSQEIATLKSEISRLQQMIDGFQKVPQSFVQMHPGGDYGIPYDLSFMFQKLTESGVTIDNAVEILQQAAREIDPVQMKKRPIVDAWVARWLLTNIHVAPNPFQGRIHLFVGGAGSGKTSSLVKMASHLVVKERKKIAILSTDSFKVGAVDQLKIYCQILNVPFAVIRNRKDWEWVLSQLTNVDHVLVDFPGLQLRDLDEIHLLKGLLPPEGLMPVTHFCVSATSKDGDAYEISRRYRVTNFNDIVFTNLDQSVQHGIIFNLQRQAQRPLHSFGIGNRIPEDFEPASKERVLDLIFKLTKLRRETR